MSKELNTYNHDLVEKYITNEERNEILRKTKEILRDIRYLKDHGSRTCKSSFLLIPYTLSQYYGDGGLNWRVRDILANQHYWLDDYCGDTFSAMYSYTLEGVDYAFTVLSNILSKIFCHEDKDEINVEFIPDFIIWTDYLLEVYSDTLNGRSDLIDYSYSHSPRYCKKVEKFNEVLEQTINQKVETK